MFFLLWSLLWLCHSVLGFTVEKLEKDRDRLANLELDFESTYSTKNFMDPFQKEENAYNRRDYGDGRPDGSDVSTPLDSWSVVWYVASFGGLIVFFLIVSCSEWCCRRAIRNSQNGSRNAATATTPTVPDTPPPSYDQFAPPSYESICLGRNGHEKTEYDIYVVPVHTLTTLVESRQEEAPPSYLSASGRNFVPAVTTTTRLENNRMSSVT